MDMKDVKTVKMEELENMSSEPNAFELNAKIGELERKLERSERANIELEKKLVKMEGELYAKELDTQLEEIEAARDTAMAAKSDLGYYCAETAVTGTVAVTAAVVGIATAIAHKNPRKLLKGAKVAVEYGYKAVSSIEKIEENHKKISRGLNTLYEYAREGIGRK